MKYIKFFAMIFLILILTVSCKSQNETVESKQTPPRGSKQGPPSIEKVFQMDTNNDEKLSKSEIKGPLLRDFDKIDTNSDGFITKEELEKAPKPKRGQKPPR